MSARRSKGAVRAAGREGEGASAEELLARLRAAEGGMITKMSERITDLERERAVTPKRRPGSVTPSQARSATGPARKGSWMAASQGHTALTLTDHSSSSTVLHTSVERRPGGGPGPAETFSTPATQGSLLGSRSTTGARTGRTTAQKPRQAGVGGQGVGGPTAVGPAPLSDGAVHYTLRGEQVRVPGPSAAEEAEGVRVHELVGSGSTRRELELEHVHGFRGKDSRAAVVADGAGLAVYYASHLCIVHNTHTNTQKFFSLHDGAVSAVAMHPAGTVVASAQAPSGRQASMAIRVWRPEDLAEVVALGSVADKLSTVSILAFSASGRRLASVSNDARNKLCVWDWAEGVLLVTAAGHVDHPVLCLAFSPNIEDSELVTAGKKHVRFWRIINRADRGEVAQRASEGWIDQSGERPGRFLSRLITAGEDPVPPHQPSGHFLTARRTSFGPHGVPNYVSCVEWDSVMGATCGTSCGSIYVWRDCAVVATIQNAHAGSVMSLSWDPYAQRLLSGGGDGQVCTWAVVGNSEAIVPAGEAVTVGASVRSLHLGERGHFVIGTGDNEIAVLDAQTGSVSRVLEAPLAETIGLAAHAGSNLILCGSADRCLRVYDPLARRLVRVKRFDAGVTCCAASETDDLCAVGLASGAVHVLRVSSLEEVSTHRVGRHAWRDAAFSPSGNCLALGSDTSLTVFTRDGGGGGWRVGGRCKTSVGQIDWARDGESLQTCGGAERLEVRTWRLSEARAPCLYVQGVGERLSVQGGWNTRRCLAGWGVQGAAKVAFGGNVACVDRSQDACVIAAGDDLGRVFLMAYPSLDESFISHMGECMHWGGVSQVRFALDDCVLLSLSAGDSCIFQWRIREAPTAPPPDPEDLSSVRRDLTYSAVQAAADGSAPALDDHVLNSPGKRHQGPLISPKPGTTASGNAPASAPTHVAPTPSLARAFPKRLDPTTGKFNDLNSVSSPPASGGGEMFEDVDDMTGPYSSGSENTLPSASDSSRA